MRSRRNTVWAMVRGIGTAAAVSIVLMLVLGIAVVYLNMTDDVILGINQGIKFVSIAVGVLCGVRIGGEKGFFLGFVIGILYMSIGYFCYIALGGGDFDGIAMMGEILIGGAAGAAIGAVCANISPKSHRKAAAVR